MGEAGADAGGGFAVEVAGCCGHSAVWEDFDVLRLSTQTSPLFGSILLSYTKYRDAYCVLKVEVLLDAKRLSTSV